MKKRTYILLAASLLTAWGVTGCYDDKGNYSYRDVNEMKVTFSVRDNNGNSLAVESETGTTRFKYGGDTASVIYTALVEQSMASDESNLEYVWAVTGGGRKDTVREKSLELNITSSDVAYSMAFRITDLSTNISYYKNFRLQTVQPYINSWFVLNGNAGERRISAVENPDSTEITFTEDIWKDGGNAPRFLNATDLIYTPTLKAGFGVETLMVVDPEEEDIVSKMSPFRMKVTGGGKNLMPEEFMNSGRKVVCCMDGNKETSTIVVVDELGQGYYYDNPDGRFQQFDSKDIGVYSIEKIGGMNESGYFVFWDSDGKEFRYISSSNYKIQPIESETKWEGVDEVLWMGQTNESEGNKGAIATALVKNNKTNGYTIYNFSSGDAVTYRESPIGELELDKESQFATSHYFPDRFFYTIGSRLYVCNTVTGEKNELYDAGTGTIVQLKFRMDYKSGIPAYASSCYHLGVAVNTEDAGELHDLVLTGAGDLESYKVTKGFGPILDLCFTYIERVI